MLPHRQASTHGKSGADPCLILQKLFTWVARNPAQTYALHRSGDRQVNHTTRPRVRVTPMEKIGTTPSLQSPIVLRVRRSTRGLRFVSTHYSAIEILVNRPRSRET